MARSIKKGPFIDEHLLIKVSVMNEKIYFVPLWKELDTR